MPESLLLLPLALFARQQAEILSVVTTTSPSKMTRPRIFVWFVRDDDGSMVWCAPEF